MSTSLHTSHGSQKWIKLGFHLKQKVTSIQTRPNLFYYIIYKACLYIWNKYNKTDSNHARELHGNYYKIMSNE